MTAILVLIVQALVSVPALVAGWTGKGARVAALFYLLLGGAALAASLTLAPGLPSTSAIASTAGVEAPVEGGTVAAPGPGAEACTQLVDAMKASGVIRDTSTPPKVVVNGASWNRIPEQYREPLTACLAQTLPAGSGELQIVRQ